MGCIDSDRLERAKVLEKIAVKLGGQEQQRELLMVQSVCGPLADGSKIAYVARNDAWGMSSSWAPSRRFLIYNDFLDEQVSSKTISVTLFMQMLLGFLGSDELSQAVTHTVIKSLLSVGKAAREASSGEADTELVGSVVESHIRELVFLKRGFASYDATELPNLASVSKRCHSIEERVGGSGLAASKAP